MSRRSLLHGNRKNSKRKLEELLHVKFGEMDGDNFKPANDVKNEYGQEVLSFEKKLKDDDYDIFDRLTVLVPEGEKPWGYIWTRKKEKPVHPESVRILTRELVEILGADDENREEMVDEEWNAIQLKYFKWEGRKWSQAEGLEVNLHGNHEDNFVLTIEVEQ